MRGYLRSIYRIDFLGELSSQSKGHRGMQSMGEWYEGQWGKLWEHVAGLNFWMSIRLWEEEEEEGGYAEEGRI